MLGLLSAAFLVSLSPCLLVPLATARAAPDDELKQLALKFNTIVIIGEDDRGRQQFIDKQLAPHKKDVDKTKKLLAVAVKMAQEKDQPFNYTGAYLLGTLAREMKDTEAAKTFLAIAIDKAEKLQSDQKLASAFFELMDMHFENKNFEAAERLCKEFLDKRTGPESAQYKVLALRRMIQVSALQGKTEQAQKLLEPFLKIAADDPAVMEINAWLLRYTGKYAESAKEYEKVLNAVESESLKDLIHYMLSNLYADMGDVDKATEHLEPLLKKKPDNPTYNNDLGYIWAEHDKNLDEAEKMIKKALDAEPDNSAYLDSMAWVLFKKKDFKKAKEHMQKAIQDPRTQDMVLYDHLGDIHWALDEKADAISAWKKAVDLAEKSDRDQKRKAEIEKKLKEKQ
jgi:tetratricopeptide (TPR) repeat protein